MKCLHIQRNSRGGERGTMGAPANCQQSCICEGMTREGGMKSRLVSGAPAKQHVVVLDAGEEAFAALTKFANDERLSAASFTAIGAFERATIGWFDFAAKSYRKIEVN